MVFDINPVYKAVYSDNNKKNYKITEYSKQNSSKLNKNNFSVSFEGSKQGTGTGNTASGTKKLVKSAVGLALGIAAIIIFAKGVLSDAPYYKYIPSLPMFIESLNLAPHKERIKKMFGITRLMRKK